VERGKERREGNNEQPLSQDSLTLRGGPGWSEGPPPFQRLEKGRNPGSIPVEGFSFQREGSKQIRAQRRGESTPDIQGGLMFFTEYRGVGDLPCTRGVRTASWSKPVKKSFEMGRLGNIGEWGISRRRQAPKVFYFLLISRGGNPGHKPRNAIPRISLREGENRRLKREQSFNSPPNPQKPSFPPKAGEPAKKKNEKNYGRRKGRTGTPGENGKKLPEKQLRLERIDRGYFTGARKKRPMVPVDQPTGLKKWR